MTRTQYFTATTIDGYIADANNSLSWLFEAAGSEERDESRFQQFFDGVGAMVLGATTYEWVLDHERLLESPDRWRQMYGDVPGWVFTHRDLPRLPGANLTFVHGDVQPVHQQLREAAGERNVWIVGGGDLAGQFADHGLLDEIHLEMAPATLGAGAPLLPRRLTPSELSLAVVERNGPLVYLRYDVRRSA